MFFDDPYADAAAEEEKRRRLLGLAPGGRLTTADAFNAAVADREAKMNAALADGNAALAALNGAGVPPAASLEDRRRSAILAMPSPFGNAPMQGEPDIFGEAASAALPKVSPVYQHYSATAEPSSPAFIAAQSRRIDDALAARQQVPMDTPLYADMMGPPAPGQRVSNWRMDNGVMINDGYTGAARSFLSPPGAGYTRQDPVTGELTPIAHSTDADYGTRLQMDPFTSPYLQDIYRRQGFQRELKGMEIAGELAKAQSIYGGRNEALEDRNLNAALRTAGNTALPSSVRDAVIKNTNLDPETKDMLRLDSALTGQGPKKEPINIGPVRTVKDREGNLTEKVDFTEMLSRIPDDVPQETLFKYLKEKRGVNREDIMRRLGQIYETTMNRPWYEKLSLILPASQGVHSAAQQYKEGGSVDLSRLTPELKKEHDLIMKYLGRR